MVLSGKWKPVRRQTVFGITPSRAVNERVLATINISDDGIHGWVERKILFSRFLTMRRQILVGKTDDPMVWLIEIEGTQTSLLATLDEDDNLITRWKSEIKSLDNTCIVYERH